ncbi:MAG: alcohol dehydrogenase catalytic domain-containing protein [Chloroflexota bacterium]|nr:alcohol dehydrogenase catalytic domain-containing protein [Chloroflexota bacterium]
MKGAFYQGNKSFYVGDSPPRPPGRGEVRLNIAYGGICGTDVHIYLGHMDHRTTLPQVIGHEMSGTVAEVGQGVVDFKLGDKAVVRPVVSCGRCPACKMGHYNVCHQINVLGVDTPGCFQGNWTVPAETLHRLPDDIDIKLAALVEPVAVGAHAVRLGQVTENEHVVVIGAGPIGILVALESKLKGAHVFVSEINPFRINLAREFGLEVVNPKETDLPAYVAEKTGGAGADVVFEVTGLAPGAEMMTRLARTRGRIVIVGIFAEPVPVSLGQFFLRELRLRGVRLYEPEDFETAIPLVAARAVPFERLISDVRPLERIQDTFEEIERGANFMKVLLKCSD